MIRSDWHDRFLALGFQYIELYKAGKFELEMIAALPSVRHSVVTLYGMMVRRKQICAIEDLPADKKAELRKLCRPYTGSLKRDETIEFVKAYWVLDSLASIKQP